MERLVLFSCAPKNKKANRCHKSELPLLVCPECHKKEIEKWYNYGYEDGEVGERNEFSDESEA